jgi:hypothetical protein
MCNKCLRWNFVSTLRMANIEIRTKRGFFSFKIATSKFSKTLKMKKRKNVKKFSSILIGWLIFLKLFPELRYSDFQFYFLIHFSIFEWKHLHTFKSRYVQPSVFCSFETYQLIRTPCLLRSFFSFTVELVSSNFPVGIWQ